MLFTWEGNVLTRVESRVMNIGILTHYNVASRGICLQLYAMSRALDGCGRRLFVPTCGKNYDFAKGDETCKFLTGLSNASHYLNKQHAYWPVDKHFCYRFENGREIYGGWKADPVYNAYRKGVAMSERYYGCLCATFNRVSDSALTDFFWGFGRVSRGVSLRERTPAVMVHAECGARAAKALSSRGELVSAVIEDVVVGNPSFVRPTARPAARDVIYRDIADKGYDAWARSQLTARDRIAACFADTASAFAALVVLRSRLRVSKR